MRTHLTFVASSFLLVILLLTACKKDDWCKCADQPQTSQLKEFSWHEQNTTRNYRFYYNRRGDVDSIRVTQPGLTYLYRAFYTNGRLDSAVLFNAKGEEESVNTEMVYSGNRITGFTYYYRMGDPYPYRHTVTYDNQSRITLIDSTYFFTYDANNDVVRSNLSSNTSQYATYTYDAGSNPLHAINNLFVLLVEEPYYWEFIFSQHNSLSKTYGTYVETHTNTYNERHQLVKKTMQSNDKNQNIEADFTYYP